MPPNSNVPVGFIPPKGIVPEELFCSGVVKYYLQPLGIIVANNQELAEMAAGMVKADYSPGEKPFLSIRQILAAGVNDRIREDASLKASREDIKHVVKGTFDTTWQYHYHMETQICAVVPKEDSLDIYPGTQWMDLIQVAVASVLNISENYMNMDVVGKRYPSAADYEVGLNDKGEIQYLNHSYYLDYAAGGNQPIVDKAIAIFVSSYLHDTWSVTGYSTQTDNHAGAMVRAPGNTKVMVIIETIMEHVAMELNIPPLDIRLANMDQDQNKATLKFINECRQWCDYDNRLKSVEEFNKNNRWKKKGLSLVPVTYLIGYIGNLNSRVLIYAGDGTIAVSHGGIKIGQGINTKVAQVCAYALGISLDMVSVKASSNFVSPNNFVTGIGITSEEVCYLGETLLQRMKPVKDKMDYPSWKELVKQCQLQYIELAASHMYNPYDPVQTYAVYGVCATEIEVDILTGIHQVARVDLLEDTGESMSPSIHTGQVEGAFMMGLGFWTTEKPVFDNEGRILTDRTWNYKIPCVLDIPIDFRVKFPKDNPNPNGVLHSKATAEPPLCLSCSVPIAIREAVASARKEADANAQKWYPISGPDASHFAIGEVLKRSEVGRNLPNAYASRTLNNAEQNYSTVKKELIEYVLEYQAS
ncbi:hypothetical protein ILUMI_22637 [Ignelater luminosus]|uniref:Uncharacterized protein n=1 Tax=Ignelater luminosus TaxID=2038154 RepID=A0A8K0G2R6_IGNLU|nr:hypothetical protein ILUMI_22637 [Ignelater luminosus]